MCIVFLGDMFKTVKKTIIICYNIRKKKCPAQIPPERDSTLLCDTYLILFIIFTHDFYPNTIFIQTAYTLFYDRDTE